MLKRDTAKRSRGYAPRQGVNMARTWATVYGSAWVEASDLMRYPGPLVGWKMHDILRTLDRSGVPHEFRHIHRQRKLYRLHPDVVEELLYGGKK